MANQPTSLTGDERAFYSRHLLVPEIGQAGQLKLKAASVLLVGVGGLGSPAALYLAAAGVGRLGLIDPDAVELSNLHRQILYGVGSVGQPKVAVAKARLLDLNPHLTIETFEEALTVDNAMRIIGNYDVVVDGADNFPARYLVNDACVLSGIANVHGSIHRFRGQVSVYGTADGPCYRCLFPDPPPPGDVPSCAEAGVLGVLPGLVGTIQATEAIKLILGIGEPLVGRVLSIDALTMQVRTNRLPRDHDCPVCGEHPTITQPQELPAYCTTTETSMHDETDDDNLTISPAELRCQLAGDDPIYLLDVREPHEYEACRIEGATLIPLRTLPGRLDELNREDDIIVYCHSGVRSMHATMQLRDKGFPRVRNLTGGIVAWQQTES